MSIEKSLTGLTIILIVLSLITGLISLLLNQSFEEIILLLLIPHIISSILLIILPLLRFNKKKIYTIIVIFQIITSIIIFSVRYNSHTLFTGPLLAEVHFSIGSLYVLVLIILFFYALSKGVNSA
jgi:hypothetical protein